MHLFFSNTVELAIVYRVYTSLLKARTLYLYAKLLSSLLALLYLYCNFDDIFKNHIIYMNCLSISIIELRIFFNPIELDCNWLNN